jgi:uncharacterized membrane protein
MFNAPSASSITALLSRYRVRYVYIGDLERAYYTATGISKFASAPAIFRQVYGTDAVTIYEVVSESVARASR